MRKRIRKQIVSFVLTLVLCISTFSTVVYAGSDEVYQIYVDALEKTVSSGNWNEALQVTADMNVSKDKAKAKTKLTMTSNVDVSNCWEDDMSGAKVSGSASMKIMGQTYAWNMDYENGVAHYEFTEPTQTTNDVPIDLKNLILDTMTADMLEDAKASGNKITFTVPGYKMEDAGIAAINMIPGMDNVDYGDVDVEVLLDESTGALYQINMKFHASLSYQGYAAEVDYKVENTYTSSSVSLGVSGREDENTDGQAGEENPAKEPDQEQNGGTNGDNSGENSVDNDTETPISDGLTIYSDYQNLSISKDSTITLSAGIFVGGEQKDDVSGITFWTDDSTILKIAETGIQDKLRYVKLKGVNIGTVNVYFQDSSTGYAKTVPVTVCEGDPFSYTISSVPTTSIEKYQTNFYNVNGLFVDNYNYSVNEDGTAEVSFDVYNTNYTYGAVEVFKEDGTLKKAVLIKKMTGNNTSIKKALWDNVGCIIRDFQDGDILSYRQETGYSKKTSVSVEIPKNGYLKIGIDPRNSAIVNIVNSADILMSIGKLAKKVENFDINEDAFNEALTLKLVEEKTYMTLLKDGSQLQENLWKGVAKGIRKDVIFSMDSLGDFGDAVANNISNFDLDGLIADTAKGFGWSIGEKIFKYFTGPIKKIFDGMFAFGEAVNIVRQKTDFFQNADKGVIYIQNQGGGVRSSQQITVSSDAGFSDDTSLKAFKVSLDSAAMDALKIMNPELYDKIMNGTAYTYDISLQKQGVETQPDGEVTVCIPIPKDLKIMAYLGKAKIYRVEEDGSTTEMEVRVKDGCFVFRTTHFSVYTLVGDGFLTTHNVTMVLCVMLFVFGVLLLPITKRLILR